MEATTVSKPSFPLGSPSQNPIITPVAPVSHEKALPSVVDQNFTKVNPSGCPPQGSGSTPPPSPGDGSDKNTNVDSGISPLVPPPQQEVILSKTPPLADENPLSGEMEDEGSEEDEVMERDTSGLSPSEGPFNLSNGERKRARKAAKAAKKIEKRNQKLSSTREDLSEEDEGRSKGEKGGVASPSKRRHVNFTWTNSKKKL